MWQDIAGNEEDLDEFQENINERVKFFQLLNSGILVHNDQDYVWQTNPINNNYLSGEIAYILDYSKKFKNVDFSEQLSLTLETNEDSIINTFKEQKLLKIKLADNKGIYDASSVVSSSDSLNIIPQSSRESKPERLKLKQG